MIGRDGNDRGSAGERRLVRAVVQHSFGGPEVLRVEEVPGRCRCRPRSWSGCTPPAINPVDWKTRRRRHGRGDSASRRSPSAGTSPAWWSRVGLGVTRFQVGDEVFGMPWFPRPAGGYAEYVDRALPAVRPQARGLDPRRRPPPCRWPRSPPGRPCRLRRRSSPARRVLIHAAAGGVGHFAVQFAKALGAHVIGTASAAQARLPRAARRRRGHRLPRAPDFDDTVPDIDVVIDLIGGNGERSLDVLRPGGTDLDPHRRLPNSSRARPGAGGDRLPGRARPVRR